MTSTGAPFRVAGEKRIFFAASMADVSSALCVCCGVPRAFVDRESQAHAYRQSLVRTILEAPAGEPLLVSDCRLVQLRSELRQRLTRKTLLEITRVTARA